MRKFLVFIPLVVLFVGGFIYLNVTSSELCAGSKCHYKMVCGGNSNIKAIVCATDCNDAGTKEKAQKWFKGKCSSASTPSNTYSGWKDCDVTL